MKTFHHGGRIGDMVFALWTMKALGGGKLYVSDYHKGNWDLSIAKSMEDFLIKQRYIDSVEFIRYADLPKVDYDLQKAEDDYNPEKFHTWDPTGPWPGNANIAQRYATHFGLEFDGEPWLIKEPWIGFDIVFHCPLRRSIIKERWSDLLFQLDLDGYASVVVGREDEDYWISKIPFALFNHGDLYTSYRLISSCKVFVGSVSSCNAIAEGLGKPTVVEQADGCFNVRPTVSINGKLDNEIIRHIRRLMKGV